jgi:hypothetical protein
MIASDRRGISLNQEGQRAQARGSPKTENKLQGQQVVKLRVKTVIEWLFGCWHRNVSRPFTISGRTYEVCLDCGKQFAYARVDFQHSAPGGTR